MNKRSLLNTRKAMRLSLMLCLCYSLVGLYSCHNDDNGMYNKGKLRFQMEADTTLVNSTLDKSSRSSHFSDFEDPKTYKVVISQNSEVVAEFDSYADMPEEVELEEGQYSIEANKGTETTAAFESPYFSGKQDFNIVKDKTTPVEVTASLQNSLVTVDYSKDFIETYKDYTLSFKTNKMELPLIYEKGEDRAMYFQSDAEGTKLTIGMSLVNVYGKEVEYTATTTIKPKQWSKLTVSTDGKGLNGIALDVILNDGTKEPVYINIGIPDFMEQLKGAPHVSCEAFKWTGNGIIEDAFDLGQTDAGNVLKTPAVINVTAGGKIAEMKLKLSQDENILIEYDLANLTEEQQSNLKDEFNLEIKSNEIKNKISYGFDIQPLLNSIKATDKESEYFITFSVKDALPSFHTTVRYLKGKLNKVGSPSITTELKAQEFEEETYPSETYNVEFSVPGGIKTILLKIDELNISQDITNGSSIDGIEYQKGSNNISFKNVWFNTLKAGNYNVSIEIEDLFGQKLTEKNSFAIKVNPPVFEWAMAANEGDIFAKYAFLRVKAKDASKVTFYHNGQAIDSNLEFLGKDEETSIASFVWKGLDPNNKYENIFAKYDDRFEISPISFTTEALGSIPNSDFEDWTVGPDGMEGHGDVNNILFGIKYKHTPYRSWERWYPYKNSNESHWDTVNLLTTSLGEERDGFLGAGDNKRWTRYVANSGTIRTSGHEGKYAALVRTVGWGDGNTAGTDEGLTEGNSGTKTPGELYLGVYDNEAVYGIPFSSRPRGFNFWYKYTTKNADRFIAEIVLLNGNNEIARAFFNDDEKKINTAEWNKAKVIIPDCLNKKATSMYIRFVSGISTASEDIMIKPGFGNLTTGEYVGSQLYIDDVELIYDYE